MSGQRKCSHISKGSWVLSGSGQEKEKVKLNTVGEDRGMRAELWRTVINTSSREAAALKGHWERELILHCFVLYFLLEISIYCTSLSSASVLQSTSVLFGLCFSGSSVTEIQTDFADHCVTCKCFKCVLFNQDSQLLSKRSKLFVLISTKHCSVPFSRIWQLYVVFSTLLTNHRKRPKPTVY